MTKSPKPKNVLSAFGSQLHHNGWLCIQETVHIIPSHEDQEPKDKGII